MTPHGSTSCGCWPAEDDAAAAREGWGIFQCSDSNHEDFELQCIDTPDDGADALDGDDEAWRLVADRAAEGSPLHQRAIGFLALHAPGELAHHAAHRSGRLDLCICVGCTAPEEGAA
jgi:hypothetical protein